MNHEWIQEKLFDFYDQQLPPGTRSVIASHLEGCAECQGVLSRWGETSSVFMEPLRRDPLADSFVQDVMRRIRVWSDAEDRIGWRHFARWAFPALAFSMTGFAAAFLYVAQPIQASTDSLLISDQDSTSLATWLSTPPSEDQVLDLVVKP